MCKIFSKVNDDNSIKVIDNKTSVDNLRLAHGEKAEQRVIIELCIYIYICIFIFSYRKLEPTEHKLTGTCII